MVTKDSFVLINSETLSGSQSSVSLTGMDSTYNIFKLVMYNVSPVSDDVFFKVKLITSSGVTSDSSYTAVAKEVLASGLGTITNAGETYWKWDIKNGTGTQETMNGIIHIFNANNSDEHTTVTIENSFINAVAMPGSTPGGGVHKETVAATGINISYTSGNVATGTFKLY